MHVQFCCMLGQEFGHRKKASRVGVITNTQRVSNLSSLDDHPDTVRYSYRKLYRRAFLGTDLALDEDILLSSSQFTAWVAGP
jgi:hypothetical protein